MPLNEALIEISKKERDKALADVHGILNISSLSNDTKAQQLGFLDEAIAKTRIKPAYQLAKMQSPGFVADRKFRLQFLIAESFDPQAAADRLVKHFESKMILFGSQRLTKELTLKDLDGGDRKCLEQGMVQRVVSGDHAGRVVVSCWPTRSQEAAMTEKNKVRLCMIFLSILNLRNPKLLHMILTDRQIFATITAQSLLVFSKHDKQRRE